jgi:Predicted oxidoreductases (related to aryl-alcohol dehydrogenases)
MGMSEWYGRRDIKESIATIHRALDLGINFFDTADVYGMGDNEQLLGRALNGRRDQAVIATKFGNIRDSAGNFVAVNGRPEYVQQACESSLRRLGIETIDVYYQHRVDRDTPIEETVGAMARLVEQGKIRFIGLSESSAETLRSAHATHPVTALQTEYSLWSRDPEAVILRVCRELGIGFVAYAPLGRGFLAGGITDIQDLAADDSRRNSPRFMADNLRQNLGLVERLRELANKKQCTLAQLALAWLLAHGQDISTYSRHKAPDLPRRELIGNIR